MDGLKNTQDISGTLTKHMVLNEIFFLNCKKIDIPGSLKDNVTWLW